MQHQVVTREEWLGARRAASRAREGVDAARDWLSAQRRELPWVRVDKAYRFDGPDGPRRPWPTCSPARAS